MMSEELKRQIIRIHTQQGGRLPRRLFNEFKELCRQELNFSPNMACGSCIYRQILKLYKKYDLQNDKGA